ncbi:thiamine pyrophosphokinase [Mammaliicoccus stepanovicii]|uniref:thiamine diphosphokinase n=1 Tax=Mammaliicoccus stepanovicii TaxID=643214 RepID=UPI000BA46DB4|nr:thiamine diphosphokinase [Mammaliicoccus stepanovicii]PNZ78017.1 thiamine diphosphokinase [Mammaliicoccus stepanovicii]GGI41715.1 thiamine pyrophosphokinase [Mammaliicoccus stepanovicii]
MKVKLLCSLRNIDTQILEDQDTDWIGVDRGTFELIEHNIVPISAVGDFDSVNETEFEKIKRKVKVNPVKKEKDDTDLALAVNLAVEMGYSDIEIYGATGGRLDHFMGAVQILTKPEFIENDLNISIIDQQNNIQVLKPGTHTMTQVTGMKYISFIPLNSNIRIKLDNFKYDLPYTTLKQGSTLTISNEFKEEEKHPTVTVELGNILVMQCKDK